MICFFTIFVETQRAVLYVIAYSFSIKWPIAFDQTPAQLPSHLLNTPSKLSSVVFHVCTQTDIPTDSTYSYFESTYPYFNFIISVSRRRRDLRCPTNLSAKSTPTAAFRVSTPDISSSSSSRTGRSSHLTLTPTLLSLAFPV